MRERDIFQVVTRGYTCHIIACGITMSDLWSCMVISDLLPVAPRVFLSSFFLAQLPNSKTKLQHMEFIVMSKQSLVFFWGEATIALKCSLFFQKSCQKENYHQDQLRLKEVSDRSQSFQQKTETSLHYHLLSTSISSSSINIYQHHQDLKAKMKAKKRSANWRRGNGRIDYVLFAYLNVVWSQREHSAEVLQSTRMPDKEKYCNIITYKTIQEHHCKSIIASSQEHHCKSIIVKGLLFITEPTFIICAWLIIT